jgi:hypothetical protein
MEGIKKLNLPQFRRGEVQEFVKPINLGGGMACGNLVFTFSCGALLRYSHSRKVENRW